jgi:hypothetical protein
VGYTYNLDNLRRWCIISITDTPKICLLVINDLKQMVEISIKTILEESASEIIIGYVSEKDILKLRNVSERIKFLDLQYEFDQLGLLSTDSNYQQYTESAFFSIVQLKWPLILKTLDDYPLSNVIYSDSDVIWCADASIEIQGCFQRNPDINVLVQDQSISPIETSLCMGFVAFRNSNESRVIISSAIQMHAESLKMNPKIGDDSIISDIYRTQKFKGSITPLPQSGFPIGNLANLYSQKHLFPGLGFTYLYIFHANYVLGIHRKVLLMYLVLKSIGKHRLIFSKKDQLLFQIEIMLRKIKYLFHFTVN